MAAPTVGEVVLVPFPFSDLSQSLKIANLKFAISNLQSLLTNEPYYFGAINQVADAMPLCFLEEQTARLPL